MINYTSKIRTNAQLLPADLAGYDMQYPSEFKRWILDGILPQLNTWLLEYRATPQDLIDGSTNRFLTADQYGGGSGGITGTGVIIDMGSIVSPSGFIDFGEIV